MTTVNFTQDVKIDCLLALRATGFLKTITYVHYITLESAYHKEPLSNYTLSIPEGEKLVSFFKSKRVVAISPTGADPYYFYMHPEHAGINGGLPKPHFAFEHGGNYYEYKEVPLC